MRRLEVKELIIAELQDRLGEHKKSYADSKMVHAISSLEKPIQLRNVRKTTARSASELTKHELQ